MKNLLKTIALVIVLTTCYNCTTESVDNIQEELIANSDVSVLDAPNVACSGTIPQARLTNNGTVPFNLEIYSMEGTLLNHEYNITPGNTTSWKPFIEGETLFSVTNDTFEDEKVIYTMGTCMEFDMEIGIDNKLTSATPEQL